MKLSALGAWVRARAEAAAKESDRKAGKEDKPVTAIGPAALGLECFVGSFAVDEAPDTAGICILQGHGQLGIRPVLVADRPDKALNAARPDTGKEAVGRGGVGAAVVHRR